MSQNLEKLFALEGGAKRRGDKKGSKNKKAQRGGYRCPDGSAPVKRGETTQYDAQGNPMCKTASGEWVSMVFSGNQPTGVSAELEAARANLRPTGRSLTGGKRGSKKASKGKKAMRGGGECADYYNHIANTLPKGIELAAMIQQCENAIVNAGGITAQVRKQLAKENALLACDQKAGVVNKAKCRLAANSLAGGKRRGSKKASKGKKAQRGGENAKKLCEANVDADTTLQGIKKASARLACSNLSSVEKSFTEAERKVIAAQVAASKAAAQTGGKRRGSKKASKGKKGSR